MSCLDGLCAVAGLVFAPCARSQTAVAGGSGQWSPVEALRPNTKVHVTTDHGGRTCRVFAVTEDALTCARLGADADVVVNRAEIQHINLAHYGRSALVGAVAEGLAGG